MLSRHISSVAWTSSHNSKSFSLLNLETNSQSMHSDHFVFEQPDRSIDFEDCFKVTKCLPPLSKLKHRPENRSLLRPPSHLGTNPNALTKPLTASKFCNILPNSSQHAFNCRHHKIPQYLNPSTRIYMHQLLKPGHPSLCNPIYDSRGQKGEEVS